MLAWIAFLAACISHQEDGAALFRRALLTQTPEGRAPVIRDFQADLEISFYDVDEKGAHKATRSGTITEFWKSKPGGDLYHRILKSDRTTHLCANAKGYFLWEDEAGGRARDLSVPEPIYQGLSIYLLFAIGLKGGAVLAVTPLSELLLPGSLTFLLGIVTPVVAWLLMRRVGRSTEELGVRSVTPSLGALSRRARERGTLGRGRLPSCRPSPRSPRMKRRLLPSSRRRGESRSQRPKRRCSRSRSRSSGRCC